MNTKKLGDIGLGQAIAHFTALGYTVCIPLTDSQDYDLIVDNGLELKTVQVKRTSFKKKSGHFYVSLTVKGGNRTSIGKIKRLNKDKINWLFIVTSENTKYLIPTKEINNIGAIVLSSKYNKFKR